MRTQSFDSYANSLKFDSIYYSVLIIDELFIIGCLMLYNNKFMCRNVLEELNMTILVNLLHKKIFLSNCCSIYGSIYIILYNCIHVAIYLKFLPSVIVGSIFSGGTRIPH